MREKEIEIHLVKRVKELGGRAYKFVSPGVSGVPDRLVCLPGGRVIFAELKAPGQKLRPLQELRRTELEGLGNIVVVLDSEEKVDQFITGCRRLIGGVGE